MINIRVSFEREHNSIPWETINALGPHILWVVFALAFLFWIGRARLDALLSGIQKINVAGVEIEFKQTLRQAADSRGDDVPAVELGRAARRLAQSTALLDGARMLWIDDEPDNNRYERALFESAGAIIDEAVSSEQARQDLNRAAYDLIVSDIRRGEDGEAGLKFLKMLVSEGRKTPVLFYVGEVSGPVPSGAFGIVDRPDELVHLVLDVLARCRS